MRLVLVAVTALIALAAPASVSARPDRLPPPPSNSFPWSPRPPAPPAPGTPGPTGAPLTEYDIAKAQYDATLAKYQADLEQWKLDVAACKAGHHDKCVRVEGKRRRWGTRQ
jgi:hypothetical protein